MVGGMDIEALIEAWKTAARDRGELGALLTRYHRDIHFRDPLQETQGIDAFGHAMGRFLKMARGLEIAIEDSIDGGDSAVMVWRMAFSPPLGPPMQVDGMSHLRAEGGLVRYQRDYWDLADSMVGAVPGGRRLWRALLSPVV